MVLEGTVEVEITSPLPDEGIVDRTYRIEGTVKMFDAVGAPPWVYAEEKRKEWWRPEALEETDYDRGFPLPISGEFKIDFKPDKLGDYDVSIVATPAPLPLPMIGVPPVLGRSSIMKMRVAEKPESGLEILSCSFA